MEVLEKISSGLYNYTGLKFFNLEKMAYVLGLTQTGIKYKISILWNVSAYNTLQNRRNSLCKYNKSYN